MLKVYVNLREALERLERLNGQGYKSYRTLFNLVIKYRNLRIRFTRI